MRKINLLLRSLFGLFVCLFLNQKRKLRTLYRYQVCRSIWYPSSLNSLLCIWEHLLPAYILCHQHPPPLPLQAAISVHAWDAR